MIWKRVYTFNLSEIRYFMLVPINWNCAHYHDQTTSGFDHFHMQTSNYLKLWFRIPLFQTAFFKQLDQGLLHILAKNKNIYDLLYKSRTLLNTGTWKWITTTAVKRTQKDPKCITEELFSVNINKLIIKIQFKSHIWEILRGICFEVMIQLLHKS